MEIVKEPIARNQLKVMAEKLFGDFVKAVVDLERNLMAIDAELHADLETLLLEEGSRQNNLWGINLYPERGEDWIEFDSMINIRPSSGNRSRGVEDAAIRAKIVGVVQKLVR
ncbi:hypothetical protein A3F28_01640 [Candidatus Uhrbacteria bacterium RIFCSPHIGHO2_12_FULL_57_11]|uniref:Uncharacterized protein n=2 Tax=Candidatus Uhriibacteriota TaxID=1752732 RepID=A0A1F7UL29_9BACT|nr:MAG: hypothetical protein A3D72_01650 [Candidatus Uhrbacteria bacterium RIFCSPHIGHO2_02_FULL_57_19]OGL78983.1 MAG: hypothetical protein A3F28_01640 [Candidatus Uhrbacteria bacterium RIFCSPHIGHO2_12_FULL_57_11]